MQVCVRVYVCVCARMCVSVCVRVCVYTCVSVCVPVQAAPREPPREALPKDPHASKPNKTPFNFFSVDARQKAKESYPDLTQTEVTKKVRHHSNPTTHFTSNP